MKFMAQKKQESKDKQEALERQQEELRRRRLEQQAEEAEAKRLRLAQEAEEAEAKRVRLVEAEEEILRQRALAEQAEAQASSSGWPLCGPGPEAQVQRTPSWGPELSGRSRYSQGLCAIAGPFTRALRCRGALS